MSDNLDFMAIFGGEGSLDLGSGGEDFDALFAEKEAPQPPEEKASETTEVSQPEETPAETPEPEQSKEDANAPEEEKPETPPQPVAVPEKKPAAPKVSGKPAPPPANPFEAAMRQVEEKITEDLAGELLQKPPVFQFGGVTEEITDPKKTFEQLRKEKEEDFPELEDGKLSKTIPKPKDSVIHAMKAEMEKSEGFRDMLKKAKDKDFTCKMRPHIAAQSKGIASYKGLFSSLEEMEKAPKVINFVPARDGHVYEIRCLESGRFITKARNIPELSEIQEGFTSWGGGQQQVLEPLPWGVLPDEGSGVHRQRQRGVHRSGGMRRPQRRAHLPQAGWGAVPRNLRRDRQIPHPAFLCRGFSLGAPGHHRQHHGGLCGGGSGLQHPGAGGKPMSKRFPSPPPASICAQQ